VLDDCELVWMLHGRARLTSEHGDLPLRPGQLLLLPPGVRHGFTWDRTRASRHGYVHFGLEHLEGRLSPDVRVRELTADDPLAGLCAYLLWLGRHEPEGWQARADDTLRLMLRLFVEGPLPKADRAPCWPRRWPRPSTISDASGRERRCGASGSASWLPSSMCRAVTPTASSAPASG
jgi:hypothetical protein